MLRGGLMLLDLYIKNLAIIDELKLNFNRGLNILTGETGAGKSIIVGAVKLILGDRASQELIRSGTDTALIEAVFQIKSVNQRNKIKDIISPYGLDFEDESFLFLGRELSAVGKNICRINGRMIPLALLKNIGEFLIELHGQGQQQQLTRPLVHLELLDNMGGRELQEVKDKVYHLYQRQEKCRQELDNYYFDDEEKAKKLDFLTYQLEEINKAELTAEEENFLMEEKFKINNLEKLAKTANEIYEEIYGGYKTSSIVERLGFLQKEMESLINIDSSLTSKLAGIEEALNILTETDLDIKKYMDSLSFKPQKVEEIERRLEIISTLKRKYGQTVEEIFKYKQKLEDEINEIIKNEKKVEDLKKEMELIDRELTEASGKLSLMREKTARKLETALIKALEEIALSKAKFKVSMEKEKISSLGMDRVEYLFTANPGEPLKPLSKIASGGEMSRIMLALRTILAQADEIETIIFDEIDIGIGGSAVQAVAEKLFMLSNNCQVICITHSPQIASIADSHYLITKKVKGKRTFTSVCRLSETERINEISRMVSGSQKTELTLKHAEEMFKTAKRLKTNK